jgi:hypothetical protein
MADNTVVTRIVVDASGAKTGANDFQTAAQKIISSDKAVEDAENRLAAVVKAARSTAGDAAKKAADSITAGTGAIVASTDRVVTSLARQNQILSSVATAVDPLGAALAKASGQVDALNRIISSGGPNAEKAMSLLAGATARVAEIEKAIAAAANDNAAALGRSGKAASEAAEAHRALSTQSAEAFHVLRDFATQAAMGVGPVTLLTQHMGQLAYAASGPRGIKGAFTEALAVLGRFLGPVGAIAGAVATVGGALLLLANRAAQTDQQLRQYSVGATTLGTSSLASAQDLLKFERQLRDTGVASEDAKKAIDTLRLSPVINPAAIPALTDLAHRLSALQDDGSHTVEWTEKLKTALEGGLDQTLALAKGVGVLRDGEASYYTEAARTTGALVQQQAVIELLRQRLAPYTASQSAAAQATTALGAAWHDFADKVTGSTAIKGALDIASAVATALLATVKTIITAIDGAITGIAQLYEAAADKIGKLKTLVPPILLGQSTQGGNAMPYGNVGQLPVGRNLPPGADQRVIAAGTPATTPPGTAGITYAPNAGLADAAAAFLGQGAANTQLRQFIQQTSNLDPATAA